MLGAVEVFVEGVGRVDRVELFGSVFALHTSLADADIACM